MKKVVKFGGSSLADAAQFKKVGQIIHEDESRRYVIPSAPGKRFPEDVKVTDMLYKCYGAAVREKNFTKQLEEIQQRYQGIIDGLGLDLSLDKEFEIIRQNFGQKAGREYAASRGEYLNGIIMAHYLGFEFIDAAEVIAFDENGSLLVDQTNDLLSERLSHTEKAVIPGFYGADPNGNVKTFSRGGSDVTGSLVAKAIHADMYENWTDVSGFLIADPRIIKNPKGIETITYKELRELSYMGATVLHEDAIFPVRKEGIPINIRNTNAPEEKGTLIVEGTCRKPKYTITGIAGKRGFASITIEKAMIICGGGASDDAYENAKATADVFVSGDFKHHLYVASENDDFPIVEFSHYSSEIIVQNLFEQIIAPTGVSIIKAKQNRPFKTVGGYNEI